MKKIVLAINVDCYNPRSIDFACYMARLTKSRLTGLLITEAEYVQAPLVPAMEENSQFPDRAFDNSRVDAVSHAFANACANRGVQHSVEWEKTNDEDPIIRETRFADLLIIDPQLSPGEEATATPSNFARKVLAGAECPVLLAPYSFDEIDEIVFGYDGSRSSVYAIKLFAYLFPELGEKKITVLNITEEVNGTIVEKDRIRALIQMHFNSIGFNLLHGRPKDELFGYLMGKKNIMVVLGSFGRSMLSEFFNNSTADLVIKATNLPVFIAHH